MSSRSSDRRADSASPKSKRDGAAHFPPREAERFSHVREISINYEGTSQEIIPRQPDISTRGMFINTAHPFPEGAVLKIRFRLARSGHEVNARAEVRYCLPGVGIGVEYIEISPADQRAIESELALA